jgi:hypothetical protein
MKHEDMKHEDIEAWASVGAASEVVELVCWLPVRNVF